MSAEQIYGIAGLPHHHERNAPRDDLVQENLVLRNIIDRCCYQMQRNYALKKLMENENENLRQRLFRKDNKGKKKQTNAYARHMTSTETLGVLAKEDWKGVMKEMFGNEQFRARKKQVEDECRRLEAGAKEAAKELERLRKEEERLQKEGEKARKRQLDAEEKERKRAEKKAEAERKKAQAELKKAKSEKKKAEAAQKKAEAAQKKAEAAQKRAEVNKRRAEQEAEKAHLRSPRPTPATPSPVHDQLPHTPGSIPTSKKVVRPRPVARGPRDPSSYYEDANFMMTRRSRRLASQT
jgi:chromosome segregation ATPase